MRFLKVNNIAQARALMREIHVDNYGIKIMAPKALACLIRINSISNIAANILKQEMLSLGGDVAIARDALTGRCKHTDCLLMGSLAQFMRLNAKLNKQPFGLDKLSRDLSISISNYQKDNFIFKPKGYRLNLKRRTYIMGIVNLTPDSFSGDGMYSTQYPRMQEIINYIKDMIDDGADIIDIGGESSRPGAQPVSIKEELARTIPVIKKLAKKINVPISIDTYKPEVARQALDNGAIIVNDITGLRNPEMIKVISRYKAGVVIMHMRGKPQTMQDNPVYKSLIDEIIDFLDDAIKKAVAAGISRDKIIIDPGIGFGKTFQHNLIILNKLSEFKVLGLPILVGPSRKSFIGKILKAEPGQRLFGTIGASILAAKNGAKIIRVHDVKEVKQALKVFDALNNV